MSGAKIFVLHKKDLIRIGAIVLGALVLLIAALIFLVSRDGGTQDPHGPGARFIPGTYSSMIILNDEPLHVRVTVSENEILQVYMSDMADIQRAFYPLFEPSMHNLALEVLRYQSAHITPRTDYPVTTEILHRAVKTALEMAYAE